MLAMARGDECKTASKANYACKAYDVTAPLKKSMAAPSTTYEYKVKKEEPKKSYGSWGPVFKDKKTFTDMHLC